MDAKKRANDNKFHNLTLRAYKCQYCPYWHLTHRKNKLSLH